MVSGDPFARAEEQFGRYKAQLAAGQITREQFRAALQAMMIQDANRRYWSLGADSGKWYVNNGGNWVEAEPPRQPAPPVSASPAPQAFAYPTPPPSVSPAMPPPPAASPAKPGSRKWLVISLAGVLLLCLCICTVAVLVQH
jgi:hypothetical protein